MDLSVLSPLPHCINLVLVKLAVLMHRIQSVMLSKIKQIAADKVISNGDGVVRDHTLVNPTISRCIAVGGNGGNI